MPSAMQCDPHCSEYTPCLSTCPVETCDNILDQAKEQRMCVQDTCVEGCQLKVCPDEQIYLNDTYVDCVPKATCKHVCLIENGITYMEGEIVNSDDCHTCRCNRGKLLCTGVPCSTVSHIKPITTTTPPTYQEPHKDTEDFCKSGWSDWINQDQMDVASKTKTKKKPNTKGLKIGDEEPLPSLLLLRNLGLSASCGPEFMKKIECRTVGTHMSPKQTGEDVECSLERGLVGIGPCHDYEIRVLCDCNDDIELITFPTTLPQVLQPIFTREKYELEDLPAIPPDVELVNSPCDPAVPHIEFPGDCYKFLHCEPSLDGSWKYAEKTCGPATMFHPTLMICDWPDNVKKIKPHCGETKQPIYQKTTLKPLKTALKSIESYLKPLKTTVIPTVPSKCPPGARWSDCGVPCGKSCHYYGQFLKQLGSCTHSSNVCEEGCLDASASLSCPPGHVWRDNKICVKLVDCTCMSNDGDLVKVKFSSVLN